MDEDEQFEIGDVSNDITLLDDISPSLCSPSAFLLPESPFSFLFSPLSASKSSESVSTSTQTENSENSPKHFFTVPIDCQVLDTKKVVKEKSKSKLIK